MLIIQIIIMYVFKRVHVIGLNRPILISTGYPWETWLGLKKPFLVVERDDTLVWSFGCKHLIGDPELQRIWHAVKDLFPLKGLSCLFNYQAFSLLWITLILGFNYTQANEHWKKNWRSWSFILTFGFSFIDGSKILVNQIKVSLASTYYDFQKLIIFTTPACYLKKLSKKMKPWKQNTCTNCSNSLWGQLL